MDLITPELRSVIRQFPLGSQEGLRENAKVIVKFFFPAGRYTFYATEGEEQSDDILFFGYCVSPLGPDCDEWGYASLAELRSLCVRGLTMERDLHFPIATRTVGDALNRTAA
jgi:hypothetical protein